MSPSCPGCGLTPSSGGGECQALFDQLIARDFGDSRYGRSHRLAVDTYALQHPDRYCASAKSLAAHLTGLCCAIEHGADPSVYRALLRWLDGPSPVDRPQLPAFRGGVTISEVSGTAEPEAYARAVERWSRSTWDAYAALHPLARQWTLAALTPRSAGSQARP